MRPKAIVYFEWIFLGTLALGLVQSYLSWDSAIALSATQANPATFAILTLALTFGLVLILTLLISRRRSRIAMWVSIALFVLGLPMVFALAAQGLLFGVHAITAVQTIAQIVAFGLLFTPEARQWMRGSPSPEASHR